MKEVKKTMILPVSIGTDLEGKHKQIDLGIGNALIAGCSGTGKSVLLNLILIGLLKTETDFILIDPKRVELSQFDGVGNLLHPVIKNKLDVDSVLTWCCNEIERRYTVIEKDQFKNITDYNRVASEKFKHIVIAIDEFAELSDEGKETTIIKNLNKINAIARAAGVHTVISSQRPDAKVISPKFKANIVYKIGLPVVSKVNSRVIIDQNGCEALKVGEFLISEQGSEVRKCTFPKFPESEISEYINRFKIGKPRFIKLSCKKIVEEKKKEKAAPKCKLFLIRDTLVTTTGTFFFKKKTQELVYRTLRSINFSAKKFYFPFELSILSANGIQFSIKN